MRTKIIIIALGLAVLDWGRNLILERLKSQEEWQKTRLHKGAESVKKFAADGVIGEDSHNSLPAEDVTDPDGGTKKQ